MYYVGTMVISISVFHIGNRQKNIGFVDFSIRFFFSFTIYTNRFIALFSMLHSVSIFLCDCSRSGSFCRVQNESKKMVKLDGENRIFSIKKKVYVKRLL